MSAVSTEVKESVQSEQTGMVAMIERLARSPDVDVSKLEKLLELQERIMDRNAKMAYSSALSLMQPDLPVITERGEIKNRDGKVQSTYALWEDINDAIKPMLAEHGFSMSFKTGFSDKDEIVTCVLSHRDGHSEETSMRIPRDNSGSKNEVQGVGSSISYGKRYTACALLNITSRGEDDDAVSTGRARNYNKDNSGKPDISAIKNDPRVLQYAARFRDAMDADVEEVDIAAMVFAIHDELVKLKDDYKAELYQAVADELPTKYRNAAKTYVHRHKATLK